MENTNETNNNHSFTNHTISKIAIVLSIISITFSSFSLATALSHKNFRNDRPQVTNGQQMMGKRMDTNNFDEFNRGNKPNQKRNDYRPQLERPAFENQGPSSNANETLPKEPQ